MGYSTSFPSKKKNPVKRKKFEGLFFFSVARVAELNDGRHRFSQRTDTKLSSHHGIERFPHSTVTVTPATLSIVTSFCCIPGLWCANENDSALKVILLLELDYGVKRQEGVVMVNEHEKHLMINR
jgi:hypothetical protein